MNLKLSALALSLAFLTGGKRSQPYAGWTVYTQSNFKYSGTSVNTSFTIATKWTAFLTRPYTGSLAGKTFGLSAQFIPSTPTTTLHFWGEGGPYDRHTWGPNIQFHFSTRTGAYNLSASSGSGASDYWFCSGHRIPVAASCTIAELVDMNPTLWTNGNGQRGDTIPAAFQSAMANVKTVGFSMAGSNWGDIGINSQNGTVNVNVVNFEVK